MTDTLQRLERLPEHPAPEIDPATHTLRISGHVRATRDFQLDDLLQLAGAAHTEDFDCLEGWVVPDQQWEGVALATLIDLAGPLPGVTEVSISSGTFTHVMPLDDARRALLALRLAGQPLEVAHGGPARLVVPGGECYTSIKWVDRVTLHAPGDEVRNTARSIAMRRIGLDDSAPSAID